MQIVSHAIIVGFEDIALLHIVLSAGGAGLRWALQYHLEAHRPELQSN